MWGYFTSLSLVRLALTTTGWLLLGAALSCLVILLRPRMMEDYIRLYNWYLNSDFHDLFARKVNVRPVIVVLLLPLVLFFGMVFSLLNLVVAVAYRLVTKVLGLRCFYCGHRLPWAELDLQCDHCKTRHRGPLDAQCPLCGFKPNAVHCPSCGHLIFVSLEGAPPNPNVVG
jgi:DNA-directed RNA polymerase subunit RPC12/RpoP